ncbi:MAG: UDP-glucose 4-epimerase [Solirubrobacteraceae bacterium]|jgi:UDP-glucose 4-epimerase|nr:UDP-glucose 4-epimerase [Solirubrobacteraceae bacterium]
MPERALTVAVTGPTGDIGRALLRAAERDGRVGRILGMARRPFDPGALGLTKTEYREGDVLDRAAIDALVAEADVVVHLAFVIVGGLDETRSVNLEGSRNVFAAAAAAPRARRLVYTSSVAAYGFHGDNPQPLTENAPARGSDGHYYSAQKAELEAALYEAIAGSQVEPFILRPSIVAGGDATFMIEIIPALVRRLPYMRPVLPDPGVPFQLVHQDDVASALLASIHGDGPAGVYNIAGPGELRMRELAGALGWFSVPVPRASIDLTAQVARLPLMPAKAQWLNAFRVPVVMDTTRAREQLGWTPEYDAHEVLEQTVAAAREAGLVQ